MLAARRCFFSLAIVSMTLASCRKSNDAPNESVLPSASAVAATHRPSAAPRAGERVEIPGGAFVSGTVPGEPGRKPELEPRLERIELGPFQIDKLPYPNDPAKPPMTNVSREQAIRLCAAGSARLCTELEWERACKGPSSDAYATGATWQPSCEQNPASCASGYDVLGMGALREWTASNVVPPDESPFRAAVRGADQGTPLTEHRCAHRRGIDPGARDATLGFRCCKGAPNAALVKEPREEQTFRKSDISADRVQKMLAESPATKSIAHDVKFFREPDAANTVVERGDGDKKGFLFTVAPLLWNPVAGAQFLVVAARSGEDTCFVAVFTDLGDNKFKLASSFVMRNEPGPVALAYNGYIRPRLHFSTCWGCPGESGKILYRDPDSALIVQP